MNIDRWSVERAGVSGQRGCDAGKNVNSRKRHVLVDTLGLLIAVLVLPAKYARPDQSPAKG